MKLASALLTLALLAGCGNPTITTTPAPPNSPQTTVALTVKTVADSASACIDTVIALRDTKDPKTGQGKITPATATTIGNWCSFVATTNKQITAILANGQTWEQQKVSILNLLGTVAAPTIATTIDPGAQAIVAQILTLVDQIKTQVSGGVTQ